MTDHFTRLGLPRRFSIDAGELERTYLERSRAVHPDYHLGGSDAELAASLELSAALNAAYNTLRDPFARADYLLTLAGGPSAGDRKTVPPAFLAEMLEARERVEQARGDSDTVARLGAEFASQIDSITQRIADAFAGYEGAGVPPDPATLDEIRDLLNAAKYVRGLLRDLHDA